MHTLPLTLHPATRPAPGLGPVGLWPVSSSCPRSSGVVARVQLLSSARGVWPRVQLPRPVGAGSAVPALPSLAHCLCEGCVCVCVLLMLSLPCCVGNGALVMMSSW